MDPASVALAVVKLVAPFTPFLIDASKAAGTKFLEVVGENGGNAVWEKAKSLWIKISGGADSDTKVADAAGAVATNPSSDLLRNLLADQLAARLENDKDLLDSLIGELGGEQGVQRLIIGEEAKVTNIRQRMAGVGNQNTEIGKKATAGDITQEMGFGTSSKPDDN